MLSVTALFALPGAVALDDLQRARAKVPRDEFRTLAHANHVGKLLNKHLTSSHLNTKPCNQWTSAELQDLQTHLHSLRAETHNDIYAEVSDTRALRFSSLAEHQDHWREMNAHAATHPRIAEMQRDGHCLETVMWWTHHLSEETKQQSSHLTLPRLPVTAWREPTDEEGASALAVYKTAYNPSSTCLACHGGGIPWQNDDVQPPPIPRQVNGKDRARRCDEWYGEDEGVCNACEGMAGHYWGDLPDYMIPVECEIVGTADEIAPEDRASNAFPAAFAVEMRGADRWPRASPSGNASCNFTTDCSQYDASMEGQPTPPTQPGYWYAGIHGALYVDHKPGQYGGGMLRHETVYQFPTGPEGAQESLAGGLGHNNMHLTEIHLQTPEMADVSDPGVMLNLIHMNWTNLPSGRTIVDENTLDWRRNPSPPISDAMCVCVPDPAGLPFFEGAFSNSTYKGRVRFTPPWQTTGSYGPPQNKTIVADHYVKWLFHVFVDIETGKPALFSSPYGGIASYGNWSEPDDLWPTEVGGGWRNLPTRDSCFSPTHAPTCDAYVPEPTTATTTAPATTSAPSHMQKDIIVGVFHGLLDDAEQFDACTDDAVGSVVTFQAAVEAFQAHDIAKAVADLSEAFGQIGPALSECQAAKADVAKLLAAIQALTPAKAVANFRLHESEILAALAEAANRRDAADFQGMGEQLGLAIKKLLQDEISV